MEHILAINMEFLQTLWLYVIALFAMYGRHLCFSEYIGIIDIVNILDHLWYIDIVPY
jgi:hypothetical protein